MRYLILGLLAMTVLACNEKKSDVDLFDEGRTRVNLSANKTTGYEPLTVGFEAYLENRERVLNMEVTEAKWVIKGPNGFFREVEHESFNFQDEDENKNDSFYLDFDFYQFGRYTVKLVLNDGEYVSNPVPIRVLERETGKPRRKF